MPRSKKKPSSTPAVKPAAVANQPIEQPTSHKPSANPMRWLLGLFGAVIILALVVVIGYFVYEFQYTDKVYGGVSVAGQPVGGQNFQTVNKTINDYKTELADTGLQFTYQDHTVKIGIAESTEDSEDAEDGTDSEEDTYDAASTSLIDIDTAATVQSAFAIGRSTDAMRNAREKISAFTTGTDLPLIYTINRASLLEQLKSEFAEYVTPYQDATLSVTADDITVIPSEDGEDFDWDTILTAVETNVASLKPVDLDLALEAQAAPITTADAETLIPTAAAVLDAAPLTLTYEDDTYTIDRAELATWLEGVNVNGAPTLQFNEDAMRTSLAVIAGEIDIPVKEGKFSLDQIDGSIKLTQFSDGEDGLGVDVDAAIAALRETVLQDHQSEVALTVAVTHPRANPETLEDLGITGLLGTGTTNFAGSPSNRILNIRKGADLLNGLLIAPGETFSLLDVLKPIDIEHGWYSELVIKGDKLEKEAGGGLCQVGSTAFRAAMLSGLPIVERRNHSWAISYYAYKGKAGVDATIYDPSPDFKFKNDTGHYILWRSRIEGNDIYFELWGTPDGRKGSFSDPTNYNYVSPGPTVETVDPNAAPGSRICDGHAFTGVTASFDYTVEHPDGTTDKETFTSVYKARAQQCVVGPDATTGIADSAESTEDAETDSGTNATEDTNTNTNTNSNSNTNTNTNSGRNKNTNND